MASTMIAIQIRLTSAPAAWNKSQRTKRITAATMSRWITLSYLLWLLFIVLRNVDPRSWRARLSAHVGLDTHDGVGHVITDAGWQRLDGVGHVTENPATTLERGETAL